MVPHYHSSDGWPTDLHQGVPRVSDAGPACCEAPAHRHSADPVQLEANAIPLDRRTGPEYKEMQHSADLGSSAAEHTASDAAEYPFGHAFRLDNLGLQDAQIQSITTINTNPLMLASQHACDMNGIQSSPGLALWTHFEDALGEGFDSWYTTIEGTMAGPPAMQVSPSMSDWDVWLQNHGA